MTIENTRADSSPQTGDINHLPKVASRLGGAKNRDNKRRSDETGLGIKQGNEGDQVSVESVQEYIPTPPDGGWGWVIVCSSLVCNLIVDGIGYSFGVFLLEFVEAYKANKSNVSLVGSLLCGIYLFVGPIVSALINRFGCRPVVIAGSITAATAFVLATLSPNIDVLTVTYGFMGGFGLGMIYLPSIVSVGFYFDTKRAFATGLAVCGSGLGTFIFPPLSEFLLTEFSWQGGLLIIAGIMLQGCVCGTLMRPLEAKQSPGRSEKTHGSQTFLNRHANSQELKTGFSGLELREAVNLDTSGQISSGSSRQVSPSENAKSADTPEHRLTHSQDSYTPVATTLDQGQHIHSTDVAAADTEMDMVHRLYQELIKDAPQNAAPEFAPLLEVASPVIRPGVGPTGSSRSLHVSKQDLARPLYRKDIFYSGSVSNIPEYRSQPTMKSYIASVTKIPGETELLGESYSKTFINRCCSCLPRPAHDILAEMLDMSVLRDVSFMLILVGNFTAFLGMYVPFVFLVDRAILLGLPRSQATFLISVIGISNTAVRIVIGKVADLHIVDSLVITYISLIIMGVATGVVPFCNTYPTLTVAAALFGLGMAAFISLSSIIICDRMGLEKLTNAFGVLTLVRGTAGILGPPLAGFMFDSTGTYDLSFFIGGLLLLGGASFLILLHIPALGSTRRGSGNETQEVEADNTQ